MATRVRSDDAERLRTLAAALRARWLPALLLAAAAWLTSASGGPLPAAAAPAPATAEVQIQEFRFEPGRVEIHPGTTVRWVNHDEEPHAIAFLDGQAASPALDTDDVFTRRFDAPGTYTYRCAIHPHMAGTIVVR